MGSIKGSRDHALATNEASKPNFKDWKKGNVTHYFSHSGDVSTVMCSRSHKEFLPEKSDCCLLSLHLKITHFDSVASVVITSVASVAS
jgi:hypothetical protein